MIKISGIKVKKVRIRRNQNDSLQTLRKIYVNKTLVFSSANNVYYHVTPTETHTEEVEYGSTCLKPTTFTPNKSGWTFVGWRTDEKALNSVLSSMVMNDTEIHLYALFKKNVALTYYGNGGNSSEWGDQWTTAAQQAFYNNDNYLFPKFTLEKNWYTREDYKFIGWSISDKIYNAGDEVEIRSNMSVYASWRLTTLIKSPFEVHGVAQGGTVNKTIGVFDLTGFKKLTAVIRKRNYNGNGSGGTVGIYINGVRVIYEDRFTNIRDEETYTSTAVISYGAGSKITTVATGNNEDILTIESLKVE